MLRHVHRRGIFGVTRFAYGVMEIPHFGFSSRAAKLKEENIISNSKATLLIIEAFAFKLAPENIMLIM